MPARKTRRIPEKNLRPHPPQSAGRAARAPKLAQPVLVATDGSTVASGAVTFAKLMAERGDWAPEVVTVLEPVPVSVAELALGAQAVTIHNGYADAVLGRIRTQLRRRGASEWPVTVEFGSPATAIARLTRERDVRLVVVGLGKHGKLARLMGAETAARVARLSDVPVLAVGGDTSDLLHTAVVALDFGESSARAASEAAALLEPTGRVHLVHVRWALNGRPVHDAATERKYAVDTEHKLARLAEDLSHPGLVVTWELRLGGVVEEVLAAAKDVGANLIAAGSHSHGVLDRLLIGSTPSNLLRAAPCSVLVVPPVDALAR
ncbi:MAG: universal stress protein [Gemmatimonadaceae bacterium]